MLNIGPSTRVLGLIQPMTHLAVAGGDMLRELNYLATQYPKFQAQVAGVASSDPNKSAEVARLSDLAGAIVQRQANLGLGHRGGPEPHSQRLPGQQDDDQPRCAMPSSRCGRPWGS